MNLRNELKNKYYVSTNVNVSKVKSNLVFNKKKSFNFAYVFAPILSFALIIVLSIIILNNLPMNAKSAASYDDVNYLNENYSYKIKPEGNVQKSEPGSKMDSQVADSDNVRLNSKQVITISIDTSDTVFHFELDHIDELEMVIYVKKIIDEGNTKGNIVTREKELEITSNLLLTDYTIIIVE